MGLYLNMLQLRKRQEEEPGRSGRCSRIASSPLGSRPFRRTGSQAGAPGRPRGGQGQEGGAQGTGDPGGIETPRPSIRGGAGN